MNDREPLRHSQNVMRFAAKVGVDRWIGIALIVGLTVFAILRHG